MAEEKRIITYCEAIREAMCEEMRHDENVFLMGEDIGVYGGCFGVSRGMIEQFGAERVRETPISETAFMGAAVGAAMLGKRPIVELMFSDFIGVCMDQVMNQAAKIHYMFGGKSSVPMVLRTPQGGGTGAAAQHSQTLEALFAHIPGLKVAVPGNAYDAKGLLKTAIRDNNPVIFLESKLLYKTECEVPQEEYTVPFGTAAVRHEGSDATLVSWGRTVQMCMDAAETLAADGVSCEVIDVRTLVPLDINTIIESVKKTHRLVIVHEAVKTGGFGGEIASQVCESEAFSYLTAPIRRVAAADCPVPFSAVLEKACFPDAERVVRAVREIM